MIYGVPKHDRLIKNDWFEYINREAAAQEWDAKQGGEPLDYTPMEPDRTEILPKLTGRSFRWWDGVNWRTCRVPFRGPNFLKPMGELDRQTVWGYYRNMDDGPFLPDEFKATREALNCWRVELYERCKRDIAENLKPINEGSYR